MPRQGAGKSYVHRDEIRRNAVVSDDLRFVLDCAQYIQPRFVTLVVWLVSAHQMGLNLTELRQLTGYGTETCANVLEILAGHGLVSERDPMFPGEGSRWFPVLVHGIDKDQDKGQGIEDPKIPNDPRRSRKGIDPEGIYNTSSCDNLQVSEQDHKTDHTSGSLNSEGVGCKGKQSNPAGLEENHTISPAISITFIPGPSAEQTPPAQPVKGRRRKKLKVKQPIDSARKKLELNGSPRGALADDLKAESKRRYGGRYRTYLKNPSQNPGVTEWKQKPRPNRWGPLDWVGYWLHKWCAYYGEEDPSFVDQTLHRTIKQSRERTKGGLDVYWSTGLQMERFRDSGRIFKGDGEQLKEFIDWLFGTFLPDHVDFDAVTTGRVFRVTNNYFMDRYRVRGVRPVKQKKKKPKGTWHPWGYTYEE